MERWRPKYQRSGRKRKSLILSEFCGLTGHDRKHAIKLLNGQRGCRERPPGRKPLYDSDVADELHALWLYTDQLCSKLLKAAIPDWLAYYEAERGVLRADLRQRLLDISPAQIDRLLKPFRVSEPKWSRHWPKPGTLIRSEVQIRTGPWKVSGPGYMEADTVAHCGGSMFGNFFWSLVLTDIHSQWTATRSVWNRGQHEVLGGIRAIEHTLPFDLLALDVDNGGEFINWHLLNYLKKRSKRAVYFTRSRAYRKNDQAHVEQKNWSHVRQLLGYDRLDNREIKEELNRLWAYADAYRNFFIPCMKLVRKERVGSRYRKEYDDPRTPCQRVLEVASEPEIKQLKEQKEQLNPITLKKNIEESLRKIWRITSCPQPANDGPTSNKAHSPAADRLWTTRKKETKVSPIMSQRIIA